MHFLEVSLVLGEDDSAAAKPSGVPPGGWTTPRSHQSPSLGRWGSLPPPSRAGPCGHLPGLEVSPMKGAPNYSPCSPPPGGEGCPDKGVSSHLFSKKQQTTLAASTEFLRFMGFSEIYRKQTPSQATVQGRALRKGLFFCSTSLTHL